MPPDSRPDGLDHVRELIDGAREWLAPSGRVLLELSARQHHAAAAHAHRAGLHPQSQHRGDRQTVVLELGTAGRRGGAWSGGDWRA